jgi:Golgi phosphoprotein 3
MLTFAEEIMLLVLDDTRGEVKELPAGALGWALAGAVLMELALAGRIDTDLTSLTVTNPAPTGDTLLDAVLSELAGRPKPRSTRHWLGVLAAQEDAIREEALARLIKRGILRREEQRILWVFSSRRYPTIDNLERKEVRARLRDLILSDELPDPRDVVLISLIETCRLFSEVLSEDERVKARPRIMQLARLDLIGQEVTRAVREIERAVGLAVRQ